jgi:dTDP-4-dehydrorhamnose 3,5-epimerase-like enzyme
MGDIQNCKTIRLQVLDGGSRGHLSVGEVSRQIPFDIKRFYTITRLNPGAVRGRHAHRQLEQVLFCLKGKAEIFLDDGTKSKTVVLDGPDTGLYVPPGIWHEVRKFEDGAILLVLASGIFDESDYIRDYEEFRNPS